MEQDIFSLSGPQRAALKRAGHALSPVVMVGAEGLSAGVVAAVASALADHELVKVKFQDFKAERRVLSERLATDTAAQFIALRGNVLLLFKQAVQDPRYRDKLR